MGVTGICVGCCVCAAGICGEIQGYKGIYGDVQDLLGYTGIKGYTGCHNLYNLFVAQCNKRMIQIMTHSLLHAVCHLGPQTKKDDTNYDAYQKR